MTAERTYIVGSKGGGCFPVGTKIKTPSGQVNIEDLKVDDVVLSFTEHGVAEPAFISHIIKHQRDEIDGWLITIEHEQGELACTSNHWIWLNHEMVEARHLKAGDVLTMFDGSKSVIKSLTTSDMPDVVYDLTIQPNHTLFANNVRASNKGGGKGGGGGGSPVPAKEDPNTLRSRSVARVIDLISEGEIGGLIDGVKSVYLDDTPIQNSDGSYNFSGVIVEERKGTPDQEHISGFNNVESSFAIGIEVKYDTPVVKTLTNENSDGALIILRFSSLVSQDTTTGDLHGSSVEVAFDTKPTSSGTWSEVYRTTISGKTTSPYEWSVRLNRPAAATLGTTWDIRVRRLTADDTKAAIRSAFTLNTITEIEDEKYIYPDSAIIGISVDAEVAGGRIPQRAYEVQGIKVKVPTGYNTDTRAYPAIWDGTFTLAVSDNPAWILYDLLTNDRYGMGEYTKTGSLDGDGAEGFKVDKYAFYNIAKYCDEMVPDGFGGYEPRFTMNCVLNTQQDAFKLIQTLASAFRGMAFISNDTVVPIQDSPKDPVKLVNPANVIDGEFVYRSTSLAARHTAAVVTWNDPNNRFLPALEVIEDNGGIERYGYNSLDVVAFGCTSRGQAHRYGKWILDTEKNETETVTYKASFDHADIFPGQVILLSDPNWHTIDVNNIKNLCGRIKSYDLATGEFELDRTVVFANKAYSIFVTLPDGSTFEGGLNETNGSFSTVTSGDLPAQEPAAGATFVIIDASADPTWEETPRKFRVVSKREIAKNVYEITAVLYDGNKYARVEEGINIEPLKPSPIDVTKILPPSNFVWQVVQKPTQYGMKKFLQVSFDPSPTPQIMGYKIEWRRDYNNFVLLGTSPVTGFEIPDPVTGVYDVRVTAIHITGRTSVPATDTYDYLDEETQDLPRINGLELTLKGNDVEFGGPTAFFSWRKTSSAGSVEQMLWASGKVDSGFMDPSFKDYEVNILDEDGDLLRTEYVIDPFYRYDFDKMYEDLGSHRKIRNFEIRVRMRTQYNNYSETAKLRVNNPIPYYPTNVRVEATSPTTITWSLDQPEDLDWEGIVVFVSTDPKFTASSGNCLYDGTATSGTLNLAAGNTYYIKFGVYDKYTSVWDKYDPTKINVTGYYQVTTKT